MTEFAGLDSVLAELAVLPPEEATDSARADQDRRWAAGERVLAEVYLDALPAVVADPELAMVLIYGEVLARTARSEAPVLAEYQSRFPQWADRLVLQFQIHSALGEASSASHDPDSTLPLDGTDPGSSHDPAHPAVIGPYRVLGELGRGGMGVVYSAWDATLNREVAVKTLPAKVASATDLAARFVRESHITARLPHPGIPPVYGLGQQSDGTPYLAMKRVRGDTLQSLASNQPVPARWLTMFEAVCQAVGFAHSQGVVHRDLKPANIMVGAFGEVQVMDWGLARQTRNAEAGTRNEEGGTERPVPDSDFTQAGTIVGTPSYMAPEQARGEPADARADVFALGGLLTFLLTGSPVFAKGSGVDTLKLARAGDTAETLTRLDASGADAELLALAKRCLAANPTDRPANGAEVADAVAAHRAGVELRLRKAEEAKATAEARAEEQRKRRRVQLALAGVVFLLLAVGSGFVWREDRLASNREQERVIRELETAARQRRAEEGIARAISQAAELRGKGLWSQAEKALAQAETVSADLTDAAGVARVREARRRLGVARELEESASAWVDVLRRNKTAPATRARARVAFADAGIDVRAESLEEVANALAASPLRADLIAALMTWTGIEPDPAVRGRVAAVLTAATNRAAPAEWSATDYYLRSVGPPTADMGREILLDGLTRHPTDFWLLSALASHYERRKEFARAAEVYRALRAVRPESHDTCDSLAMMAMALNDSPRAEAHCLESIRLKETPLAWDYLARVRQARRDHAGALVAHRRAIELAPDDPLIRGNYGTTLRFAGHIPAALDEFRRAIAGAPDVAKHRLNLAATLRLDVKDLPAATTELVALRDKQLATSPEDRRRLAIELAEVSRDTRDPNAAVELLHDASALAPDAWAIWHRLGWALVGLHDEPRAACAFARVVALAPERADGYAALGNRCIAQKDYSEAVAWLRTAVEKPGVTAETFSAYGTGLTRLREWSRAADAFQRATDLDANWVVPWEMLALTRHTSGEWEAAIVAYERAIRLNSKRAAVFRVEIEKCKTLIRNRREVAPPPRPVPSR